jgi:hypothetical protein
VDEVEFDEMDPDVAKVELILSCLATIGICGIYS